MSLATCLRKFGQSIPAADRRQMRALVKNGMSEAEAVGQVLEAARADLTGVVDRIRAAGGQVRETMYQRAFHGSPHEFERFSLEKIGTGEGAQVFGHGLYFTSKKEIADYYRRQLAGRERVIVGGKDETQQAMFGNDNPREIAVADLRQEYENQKFLGAPTDSATVVELTRRRVAGILSSARERLAMAEAARESDLALVGGTEDTQLPYVEGARRDIRNIEARAAALEQIAAEGVEFRSPGVTYEVEIPNDNELANWDEDMEFQPEATKEAARVALAVPTWEGSYNYFTREEADRIADSLRRSGMSERVMVRQGPEPETGREWQVMLKPALGDRFSEAYKYASEHRYEGSDKAVSEALRAAGVKGHTYIGQTSNERNYVIYDDAAIETKAMYSRAGAIPAGTPSGIQALMDRVMAKPREAVTMRDRAREMWRNLTNIDTDSIRQGVIDSFDAIKQLEKGEFGAVLDAAESPYKAALATRNLPSVMAAVMMRGPLQYKEGAFQLKANGKGIIEIFQPLAEHRDGNLLPLWELYAAASREQGLMRRQGYKPLFSDAERREALALADQYPIFREVSSDWQKFNNEILDLAVDRGVLDAGMVKLWRDNFYVPFYRAMEDASAEGPATKHGLGGHGGARVKKRLKGSEKPLGHVFENMLMNTAYLLDESFKNTAMQKLAAMGEGTVMERLPLKWDAVKLPAGQLERALDKLGGMVMGFKPDPTSPTGQSWQPGLTADEREQWLKLFRRVAPVGKDVVSVYENGKPTYYRVTDDLLLRSIGNMGHDNFADVFGLFRGSKRLLTSAITLDPAFMLANWVRDTLSTWVVSDAGIRPVIDSIKGAKAALTMDSDLLAIMAAGGGGGGVYDMQPEDLRKFLVDKLGSEAAATRFTKTIVTPSNWLTVWRKIGNAAENANRVAVYKAVRAAGGTVAEAAYQARDVLNFSMSGDYAAMRWLTATVPFMNARIQGLYRLYRGAQENPGAFALKGMALMAATLALLLKNSDDERYDRLTEWDRDMYWHFWLGGEHYRLPKPFEVGALFGTVPERLYRLGTGRDSASLTKQRVMAMLGETFAFNPVPQVIKPIIEQYANRSFFTGSPIVGMSEIDLEPEAQYTPWTSDTMRMMAEALPDWAPAWLRSPRRLEAAMRGYLGATGMYALQAGDAVTRTLAGAPPQPARNIYDMPVVRRFLQDPNPRYTKYSDQLYEFAGEANSILRTINRYREQGRTEEARALAESERGKLAARANLNRIATQVRAINNQIRLVMFNQTIDPEEKRERIDTLNARKNDLTARVERFVGLF
jgi:hypothetical protein